MTLAQDPKPGAAGPSARDLIVACVAIGLGAASFVYYAQILEHRWYVGAFLMDFGWFNYLASGQSATLQDPSGMDAWSYFSVHVSPLLLGFATLSRLIGLTGPQPIVLMLSTAFGGSAAMALVILERLLRPSGSVLAIALGASGAVVYAVSGVMRSVADYPHIELLYVPLALLMLHLLFRRRFLGAWAALAFCLMAREDSGLHLACILGAYLVLSAFDERAAPARLREIAPFLAVCLLYPAAVIVWQRTAYPGSSTFTAIYTGDPPYRHFTPALMAHRAALLVSARAWISFTVLAALCVLPFQRRWVALTGFIAALPWFLLNISAFSVAAGELQLYYGFPFLVTALAPLIVVGAAAPPPRQDRLDVVPL